MKHPLLIAAAFASLASCDAPLQEQYVLSSQSSLPEGVAFDAASESFFATAIQGGQITRVTALGQELVFHRSDDLNLSFSGAHVDDARRVLWVCAVDVKSSPTPRSKIVGFDIRGGGKIVRSVDLGEGSFCNDLTTDDDGAVYASDSALPHIYRLAPGAEGVDVFATDPRFAPASPGLIGLNGLDISPDGEHLLVAKSVPATLFRVPLHEPDEIGVVTFSGDPFGMPGDPRFPGPDGIEFLDEELYVAFDGGVQQLRFAGDDFAHAFVRTTTAVPTGLSSLTVADGRLYAIDSEVYRVLYGGQPPELPFRILHVDTGLFDAR